MYIYIYIYIYMYTYMFFFFFYHMVTQRLHTCQTKLVQCKDTEKTGERDSCYRAERGKNWKE